MKKYVKTIIIVSVLALMCIAYFFYLSNRKSTKDATDKSVWNQEVAALTTKDIDKNYPESPKEVVKLYARITKAYYKTSLTDEQIEALGTNARKLFDNDVEKLDTTYFNVIDVLKGEEVLKFDEEIKGNILVASYNEDTFNKNVKLSSDNILIVGDRHEIIENAINSKIKLLIVTGNGNIKKENLES